ncbi:MAG: hypothetical protein CL933_12165 [Deltaproteobacteria bacterium]|nr:hypothetical protein [Deltaproteobacteria bacterium]
MRILRLAGGGAIRIQSAAPYGAIILTESIESRGSEKRRESSGAPRGTAAIPRNGIDRLERDQQVDQKRQEDC